MSENESKTGKSAVGKIVYTHASQVSSAFMPKPAEMSRILTKTKQS